MFDLRIQTCFLAFTYTKPNILTSIDHTFIHCNQGTIKNRIINKYDCSLSYIAKIKQKKMKILIKLQFKCLERRQKEGLISNTENEKASESVESSREIVRGNSVFKIGKDHISKGLELRKNGMCLGDTKVFNLITLYI